MNWLPDEYRPLFAFLRAEIGAEEATGWSRLKALPSTQVWRALQFHEKLSGEDRDALLDCWATSSCASNAFLVGLPFADHKSHPFFERWLGSIAYIDPSTLGIPILRYTGTFTKTYPKAPVLRKRVKATLGAAGLLKRVQRLGGGDWIYQFEGGATPFQLHIDYGGSYAQLRYRVKVPRVTASPVGEPGVFDLSVERAFGVGSGDWDFITDENVDDVMARLVECVRYCVELPEKVMRACPRS